MEDEPALQRTVADEKISKVDAADFKPSKAKKGQSSSSRSSEQGGKPKDSQSSGEEESDQVPKEPLSDTWIFDTVLCQWFEIRPQLRIQGSSAGKKIKKNFENRLAHTAVILD